MSLSSEQFLNDTKTQIYQYVYRSTEMPFDSLLKFLQEISGNGNLNWHKQENKEHLLAILTKLQEAISSYSLENGDFRSFMQLAFVNIVTEEYLNSLFELYLKQGYNVAPESIVGSLADAYTTAPPQNTNFPGLKNTSNDFVPELPTTRLVPKTLYSSNID